MSNELKKYAVPVIFEASGHITVMATDKKSAVQAAEEAYDGLKSIEYPCVDIWYPEEDEFDEVEEVIDDNESGEGG